MIPRADVAEGEEDGEGKEGNWGVEEGHRTNSLSSYELQRVSNDWGSMSDLEADHVSLSMDGATNGKCTTELPEPSSIPAKCINIHFHCSDPDTLKVSQTKHLISKEFSSFSFLGGFKWMFI